ncbi:cytochrome c oxidase assembly protein, putative [Acanthamoeba castellanii str. Neff]|uniref:Cytochrome c oxidase assembly protein, putative n=1 Tax=Acanthamoeba castellanii (strain ATCC 30010 / Neff) TaxID=1257118 RepID=L8HGT1_ACACF|nr:cytochrome c oxidase assembly protein, putative [Acanthamoeba castellanii str. Neff]ELR23621.1 cytochrome c oxidase assembly protein, putative [Acanthamoeba castellanii str. Neff]
MTSHSMRNKAPLVLPPEKGSFPLDREQACSEKGSIYRTCLRDHNNSSSICRQKARDYFECRMDHGLMQREPWDKLGLGDDQIEEKSAPIDVHTKEQTGWVAGAKYRQRPSS